MAARQGCQVLDSGSERINAQLGLGKLILMSQRQGPREHIYLVLFSIAIVAVDIHHDRYSRADIGEALADYDAELREFYEQRGRNLDESAWTGPVARGSSALRYAGLRSDLEQLGFRFD